MAEGLLRARAGEAGLDIEVHSAGSMSGGEPATASAIKVCAERGVDISAHRSRRLQWTMVAEADLIIAMSRQHLREAVVLDPTAFSRIYTLRELVRRAEANPHATLAELHRGRALRQYEASDPADDIADPVGKPAAVYAKTAVELDDLIRRLLPALGNLSAMTPSRGTG